jgi:outer membrane protein TolC
VATKLDVTQARALLKQTEALIPRLETSLRQAKNGLAILLGILPAEVQGELGGPRPIPTAPAQIAVGIPAELLRRRPDIRLAEFQAAAQSARIGVAKSDLYPRFSLVGSIGLQSSDKGGVLANNANFSDLFSSDSITYFVGPTLQWPILNYGRLKNNVRVQDARFQQLVVNYQNTVLQAAQEVEDAMVGFLRTQEETILLSESVANYRLSVDISLLQYRHPKIFDPTGRQPGIDHRVYCHQPDCHVQGPGRRLGTASWQGFHPGENNGGDAVLPPEDLPKDIEEEPPTGQAIPVFNKPDL